MIYEVRTYDLKPRAVPEVEKRFGELYEAKRRKYSELAAFFHTEVGPLNQIVHIWPYKDMEERGRIRATAVKDKAWPPNIGEFIVNMRSDIFIPFDISPELKPASVGPFFEMRIYTYASGQLPIIMKNWESAIQGRIKYSPLTAAWYSDIGGLNKFVHIWPYKSLDQRWEVRNKIRAEGIWPPSEVAAKRGEPGYQLLSQENKILMPASFSPLK